jgi:hypothetical protein
MSFLTLSDNPNGNGFRIDNSKTSKFVKFHLDDRKRFELETNAPAWCSTEFTNTYRGPRVFTVGFSDYISSHEYIKRIMDYALEGTPFKFKRELKPMAVKKATQWIKLNWSRMLARPIADKLNKLREQVDPEVLKFQRKLFSVVGPTSKIKPMVLDTTDRFVSKVLRDTIASKEYFSNNAAVLAYIYYYRDYPIKYFYNWMSLYSPNQKVYGNLSKTLLAVPGGVGASLFGLRHIKLERPVTCKTELRALLKYQSLVCHHGFLDDSYYHDDYAYLNENITIANDCRNFHCFMYASLERLRKAAEIVGNAMHYKLNIQTKVGMNSLIGYLRDYPETHNGEIVGLAEKSVKWHREAAQRNLEKYLKSADKNRVAAKPPIELPRNENIKFLSTVAEIVNEGVEMGHCIGSYSNYAAQGACFLFSVSYNGQRASAEVSPQGEVRQCHGPHNSKNKAVDYGLRVLRKWAQGFRTTNSNSNDEEAISEHEIAPPF